MDESRIILPDEVEETIDSRRDARMDEDALAAIAEAEREAPDPGEFGLRVAAPLGEGRQDALHRAVFCNGAACYAEPPFFQ